MDFKNRTKMALIFMLFSCNANASDTASAQIVSESTDTSPKHKSLLANCREIVSQSVTKDTAFCFAGDIALRLLSNKSHMVISSTAVSVYKYIKWYIAFLRREYEIRDIVFENEYRNDPKGLPSLSKSYYNDNVLMFYKIQHRLMSIYSLSSIFVYSGASILAVVDDNIKPPLIINEAFNKLNHRYDPNNITISKYVGKNAFAWPNGHITIGIDFLKMSNSTIMFILGHEISHIKNYDSLKTTIFSYLSYVILQSGLNATKQILENLLDKYGAEDHPHINKMLKYSLITIDSPLFIFLSNKAIMAKYSRYKEKNADIASAKKLGVSGGIEFFEKLKKDQETTAQKTQVSIMKLLNPLFYIEKIDSLPVFTSHPTPAERIQYLKKFEKTL